MIPRADALLGRALWRYLTRYPWQLGLAVAGIAIGVAVVVAVDIATTAAMRAFEVSMQAVTGRATDRISGAAGGIDEILYRRLRVELGLRASAPVVEGYVTVRGETLQLMGLDPFAEAPVRDYLGDAARAPVADLLTQPGGLLIAKATAERLRLERGERFTLEVGGRRKRVKLLDFLYPGRQPSAGIQGLAVADIASAQVLLNKAGRLSWIDLRLPGGRRGAELRSHVETWLPTGVWLERAEARGKATAQMTRAFFINLTAMSWLALLVGMFLIYSTMTLSVLRRRRLIANLRALGVTRAQVFRVILAEAAVISVIAVLLGLPAGAVLGQGLVGLVTRTINDMYFALAVERAFIDPITLFQGAALGVGASLAAAVVPAWEAATASPREAQTRSRLEGRARRLAPRLSLTGFGLMLLGGLLLAPARSLSLGFAALLLLVVGFALTVPGGVMLMTRAVSGLLARAFPIEGRLAARGVEAGLSRTGVAAAALVVAIAATSGVTIMIQSFRATVVDWLQSVLQADIYITLPGPSGEDAGPVLAPGVVRRLARVDGIDAMVTHRWVSVRSGAQRAQLHVIESAPQSRRGTVFKEGDPRQAWAAFERRSAVLVSEPYAYRRQLGVGDALSLWSDRGARRFRVAGVFFDYGSDQGVVVMRRGLYERFWRDRGVSSLGVYVRPSMRGQLVLERLRDAAEGKQRLLMRSNRDLYVQSLRIFDRTFAITHVLRLLAVMVATAGILSALMALQLERERDFAILRATGFTPRQVKALTLGEAGLLGSFCGVLAIPLAIVMSLVLIEVVNRRSFGWSMQVTMTSEALLQALGLALAAALLAGTYPAWKLSTARPAVALRSE